MEHTQLLSHLVIIKSGDTSSVRTGVFSMTTHWICTDVLLNKIQPLGLHKYRKHQSSQWMNYLFLARHTQIPISFRSLYFKLKGLKMTQQSSVPNYIEYSTIAVTPMHPLMCASTSWCHIWLKSNCCPVTGNDNCTSPPYPASWLNKLLNGICSKWPYFILKFD